MKNLTTQTVPEIRIPKWDEREFAFFPADPSKAVTLSANQVEHYNREGYVKNLKAFTPEEAAANRAYFDGLLAQLQAQGRDSYSLNWYHKACAGIYNICSHPSILRYVTDILGRNFVAWGSHFFCKMPGDGKAVAWHQDATYWPLTPTRTVTVWLAIDDADRGNGAMQVIPRSHVHGALPVHDSEERENNLLLKTAIVSDEQARQAVYFEMKAGEMSMHSDLLLHSSSPNYSDRRRCGLTIRYAAADVRCAEIPDNPPFLDFTLRGTRAKQLWNYASIHCVDGDGSGHWADIPRPTGENLSWTIE